MQTSIYVLDSIVKYSDIFLWCCLIHAVPLVLYKNLKTSHNNQYQCGFSFELLTLFEKENPYFFTFSVSLYAFIFSI